MTQCRHTAAVVLCLGVSQHLLRQKPVDVQKLLCRCIQFGGSAVKGRQREVVEGIFIVWAPMLDGVLFMILSKVVHTVNLVKIGDIPVHGVISHIGALGLEMEYQLRSILRVRLIADSSGFLILFGLAGYHQWRICIILLNTA